MSEQYEDRAAQDEPEAACGAGRLLREAREASGESIGDIAHALKLSVRQIEAIEQERFDLLPGVAFARGFVRNYARHLGLDAELVVSRMPGAGAPVQRVELSPVANADGTMPDEDGERRVQRPVRILVIGMLLMLAVGWYFDWFQVDDRPVAVRNPQEKAPLDPPMPPEILTEGSGRGAPQPATAAVPSEPVRAPEPSPPAAELAVAPALVEADRAEAEGRETGLDAPGSAVSSGPVGEDVRAAVGSHAGEPGGSGAMEAGAVATAPAELPPVPMEPTASGMERLVFRLAGESWIQVRDAEGVTLFTGVGAPGTERVVQGRGPFDLVIGNASKVELERDGVAVDLVPHTRSGGVARLKLEQAGQ